VPASLVPGVRAAAGGAFADAMHVALLVTGIAAVAVLAVALALVATHPHRAALAAEPAPGPAESRPPQGVDSAAGRS
jgi:hypothetical protein